MSVAKVYAKALYEAAIEKSADEAAMSELIKQLEQVSKTIQSSKELKIALFAPITTSKEKAAVVRELAKKMSLTKLVSDFLVLLASKDRMSLLEKIREEFAAVRLLAEGGLPGTLVAAEEIDGKDVENLSKAFSRKLGKQVAFQVTTDPSLLAGIKVTVNGVTYDGTLRSQLQRLRDRFLIAAPDGNLT